MARASLAIAAAVIALVLALLLVVSRSSSAPVSAPVTLTSSARAVVPRLKQPSWAELSPQQRTILAPLALEWDKLASYRRKKWLGVARQYPSLSPAGQQRLQ